MLILYSIPRSFSPVVVNLAFNVFGGWVALDRGYLEFHLVGDIRRDCRDTSNYLNMMIYCHYQSDWPQIENGKVDEVGVVVEEEGNHNNETDGTVPALPSLHYYHY